MKKLIGILVAAALLLCACAQGSGEDIAVTGSKKDSFTPSGQKVESSVFGRNVKYNSFTPAENISLPIESTEILNAVQIDKRLYILVGGAVHSLDIETGESARLFDTNAALLAADGSELMLFDAEASEFCTYDTSGLLLQQMTVSELSVDNTADFASSHNGEYVGLPYGVRFELNQHENVSGFTAIDQYCIKYVDALNMRFTDESGDELYKIMKFAAESPEPKKAYYNFPYSVLWTDYLIINPSSERKALAADFMEYAFDVYSGEQSVVSMNDDMLEYMEDFYKPAGFWERYCDPIDYHYPDMTSTENVYLEMDFRPWSIVEPIFNAYNSARYGEVMDKSEMKKQAKDAAAEVKIRLME